LGSTLNNTETVRQVLPNLFEKYDITSVVDVPCGDFNWMRYVLQNSSRITNYIGLDIVPEIIHLNMKNYSASRIRFEQSNVITTQPPFGDVVIMRDCLIHFSFVDAAKALRNIKQSGARLFLSTTYPQVTKNQDIVTGRWRPVNLETAPFNFPPPMELIHEDPSSGKCMGLWRPADLPDFR
jgi:hypothetical protein